MTGVGTTPAASDAVVDADNPWPGLAAYGASDSAYFKGRDRELDELLRLVRGHRVSVLYGASGLGKTSLLRAGLCPRLAAADELAVYLRLDLGERATPLVEQVVDALRGAAARSQVEAPPRHDGEPLWQWLHRRQSAFFNSRSRLVTPVLILDQFEEVFTRGLATPEAAPRVQRFLGELADLAEGRPPQALMAAVDRDPDAAAAYDFGRHRYRIVLSLREDYLAPLDELRSAMPSIMLARYRLQPMNGEQALLVADQTAGRLVDPASAERIVRIAAGRPYHDDKPPPLAELRIDSALLGLFCRELNLRRRAAGLDRIGDELVLAGHRNILEGFYEDCMRRVGPALRRFVEDELITANALRDSRVVEDMLAMPGIAAQDVAALVDARLLREEDRGGVRRVELGHDVLTRVVRQSRDARRTQQRVEAEQAAERQRLRDDKEAAEREVLRQKAQATDIAEQRAAEAERLLRQLRRRTVAVGIAGALAAVLAVWGYSESIRARSEAERARRAADESAWQAARAQAAASASAQSQAVAEQALAAARSALDTAPQAPPSRLGGLVKQAPAPPPQQVEAKQLLAQAQRSYDSARQVTQALQDCPAGRRVYPQVGSEDDRSVAEALTPALRAAGFIVPPVEVVPAAKLPSKAELRYFRNVETEADGARAAVAALQSAGLRNVAAKYVSGYENSTALRPCHYELWLPAAPSR